MPIWINKSRCYYITRGDPLLVGQRERREEV